MHDKKFIAFFCGFFAECGGVLLEARTAQKQNPKTRLTQKSNTARVSKGNSAKHKIFIELV